MFCLFSRSLWKCGHRTTIKLVLNVAICWASNTPALHCAPQYPTPQYPAPRDPIPTLLTPLYNTLCTFRCSQLQYKSSCHTPALPSWTTTTQWYLTVLTISSECEDSHMTRTSVKRTWYVLHLSRVSRVCVFVCSCVREFVTCLRMYLCWFMWTFDVLQYCLCECLIMSGFEQVWFCFHLFMREPV